MLRDTQSGSLKARASKAALWLAVGAGFFGVQGILGNLLDSELLCAVIPGRPRMRFVTAITVVLAASILVLQHGEARNRARRFVAYVLAAVVALSGIIIVSEYVVHAQFGIEWQLTRWLPAVTDAGPASPLTGATAAVLGLVMLLRDAKRRPLVAARRWLGLLGVFFAFVSLVGHAFDAGLLYRVGGSSVTGVALPTSAALTLLGAGVLLQTPTGSLELLVAKRAGGMLLRRLGLMALIAGPLLGALLWSLAKLAGLTDLPLLLAIGNVAGVFLALALLMATARSIERAAEAAETSRARQRELFELAPEGIFVADLAGRYAEVNDAGCRLLGLRRDQILGKTILDFLPAGDAERLWQSQRQMLQGIPHTGEWKLRRGDGRYQPVEVTAKVLPDGRWQAFVRDIGERVELRQELQESRDFLEQVLDSSTGYAIVAEDAEHRVLSWNAGARLMYGYEGPEICGREDAALVAEGELAAFRALQTQAIEQGSAEGVVIARRKDKTTFAAYVVCTRRQSPIPQRTGVLIVSRDLTLEQRLLNEQQFLARVGIELASSREFGDTINRVVRLATSFLGDVAAIDVVRDGGMSRAQAMHRKPEENGLAQAVVSVGSAHAPGHPLMQVRMTREPVLLRHITDEERKRFATSKEHARVLEAVNATSAMLVPLLARDQLLGVLSIAASHGSRTYEEDDLRLAIELGRRAALALDNAQMFQQLRLQSAVATNLAEGAILIRVADTTIVYANPRFEAMFGYARDELLGQRVEVLDAEAPVETAAAIVAQLRSAREWHGEIKNKRKDGTHLWCAVSVSTFDHEEYGKVWISVHSDITARKLLEDKNLRSLREKEILLREVHHRVKNNLQVISSLFSLQRERTENAELRALLDESRMRVQSIALVHEQLYRSSELAAIDFDEYLRSMLAAIRSSYGATRVELVVDAKGVLLEAEQAVPCALLVSELVSNALKHAFVGATDGKVWVHAQRDEHGRCRLEVADNGRGIPEELEWTKARSLGLRLVQSFARQLRGVIELDCKGGTRFTVTFPLASRASPPLAQSTAREQVL